MRIAVLGAGIQGVCAALELASRGAHVHLFDKASEPVTAASLWNEGKIHLGYTYANDLAERTAYQLLAGAFSFEKLLGRHIDMSRVLASQSTPFTYVVHNESVLTPDSIARHFSYVDSIIESLPKSGEYFGRQRLDKVIPLSTNELEARYDTRYVQAAIRTAEHSLDPHVVAQLLREVVRYSKNIFFLASHTVERVTRSEKGFYSVISEHNDTVETLDGYDHVVNALWQDRLRVDAGLNLKPERPFLNRYKLAIHTESTGREPEIPSTTIVLGPFGDIVKFNRGRCYLSWYPLCRVGSSNSLQVPDWKTTITSADKLEILEGSVSELAKIIPAVGDLKFEPTTTVEGGCIFAWGSGDVGERDSELHTRFDIGVQTFDNFHTINTGKYSMAPLYGREVARRIFGDEKKHLFTPDQSAGLHQ